MLKRFYARLTSASGGKWRNLLGLKGSAGTWCAKYRNDRHLGAIQLADSAHQNFDKRSAALGDSITNNGQKKNIACHAGCFYCCNLYVSATSSELLLIEGFISGLPAQAGEAIKKRIKNSFVQAKGKSMTERDKVRVRCPLLSQRGTCEAYHVRPLTCRSYVSFDLPACKLDAENPRKRIHVSRSGSLVEIRTSLFNQLLTKERQRGYAAGSYELIQGLYTLLEREDAVEDICRGIDPIISASSR